MEKNYNYNYENRSQGQKLPVSYSNLGVSSCTSKVLKKSPVVNGSLWHTTDTNEFYYDWNGKRTKLNLTGDSAAVSAEIAKIKADVAKLDPAAIESKINAATSKAQKAVNDAKAAIDRVDDIEDSVNDAITAANNAVSAANAAAESANNAAAGIDDKIAGKADASTVDTLNTKVEDLESSLTGKADASTVDTLSEKVDGFQDTIDGKADASTVDTLNTKVGDLESSLSEKANSTDVESAINSAVAGKVNQDAFNELKDTVEAIEIPEVPTNVSAFTNDAEYITRNDIKDDLLSPEDKAALEAIKDLGPSDVETGTFPEVDPDAATDPTDAASDGLATVQDVMDYVNALFEKKKDELGPVEPGTPYAYITGYALDGTPTDIMMFNQFELNESGDTELEIWSAKEIGSYDENGNDLPSLKLTVDIPSGYSIKESYQWNPINSTYALIENGLFEENPRYASRTINGVTYNSYVRKVSDPYSVRDNTRYKIIITK